MGKRERGLGGKGVAGWEAWAWVIGSTWNRVWDVGRTGILWRGHLLVLLRAVGEQDALGLHVAVEYPLQRRHVALDDVLDLWATRSGRGVDWGRRGGRGRAGQGRSFPGQSSLTFSGSCASTSFLRRRSRKGRSTLCNRRMMRMVSSSFRSTCGRGCPV